MQIQAASDTPHSPAENVDPSSIESGVASPLYSSPAAAAASSSPAATAASILPWLIPTLLTFLGGTVTALTSKALYAYPAVGRCDTPNSTGPDHVFAKPFFLAWTLNIGEALCLIPYYYHRWQLTRAESSCAYISTPPLPVKPKVPKRILFLLACFDTSTVIFLNIGYLWISASIYSLLRGSSVVWVALFSRWLLKSVIVRRQWLAIAIVIFGLGVVATSALLGGGGADFPFDKQVLGMSLILIGSGIASLQNVIEERLLRRSEYDAIHPMECVGWEGIFGLAINSFVSLPIVAHIPGNDCGVYEDTIDSFLMFANSSVIAGNVMGFIFGIAIMYWTGMELSRVLTAVHRNLVQALRTIVVWFVNVVALWIFPGNTIVGEQLNYWSILQLFGFIILIGGTIMYGKAGEMVSIQAVQDDQMDKNVEFEPISPLEPLHQTLPIDSEPHNDAASRGEVSENG